MWKQLSFKVIFLWGLEGNDLQKKFSSFTPQRLSWVHVEAWEEYLLNGRQIWSGTCKTGDCEGTFLPFAFHAHSPAMWHHGLQSQQQGQGWEHAASCWVLGTALETRVPFLSEDMVLRHSEQFWACWLRRSGSCGFRDPSGKAGS